MLKKKFNLIKRQKPSICNKNQKYFRNIYDGILSVKNSKRRAMSDIIVTLMLVGITVAGALMVWVMFSTSSDFLDPAGMSAGNSRSGQLKIIGYDTRDGSNLSLISELDNVPDNMLCTISCDGTGTDFIVLKIRNVSLELIEMDSVSINEVLHQWDDSTSDIELGTSYPSEGTFSIISDTNSGSLIQSSSTLMQTNEQVRLVVRLSGDISSDIELNGSIRVGFSNLDVDAPVIIIDSGAAR